MPRFLNVPRSWLLFLISFILLRLVFWVAVFPNSDEAYYWLWGQHPALSYYDHPPLNAWIQSSFTALLGRSNIVLRLPNLLSNAVLLYIYYRIVSYLYDRDVWHYFLLTSMLILASPLYFLFLSLAWHDHWLITFSLISMYGFVTFLDGYVDRQAKTWRLYGSAIALGCAMLCKYNAVFVAFGFIATLIVDRRVRSLWRDYRLYVAGAIASLAGVPILIWNVSNQFQSLRYYLSRSVQPSDGSLKIGPFLAFVIASFLVVSPFYWRAFYRSLKSPSPLMRENSLYPVVAFWVFAVSSILLTILSLISAALYYWNITAYLMLFPLLPPLFASSRTFFATQLYGLFFAALLTIHYGLLPLSALVSRDADPDSRMLFGWNEVAAVVRTQAATLGGSPLLMTTDYRSASALAYQLNTKNVIAVSDRIDQFDFWSVPDHSQDEKNAVVLSDDWFPIVPKLLGQFDHVSEPETVPVRRFGIWVKNYYVQRGYRFKPGGLSEVSKNDGLHSD